MFCEPLDCYEEPPCERCDDTKADLAAERDDARAWSRRWKARAKMNRRAWRAMLAMQDEGVAARALLRCNDRREANARRALAYRGRVRSVTTAAQALLVALTPVTESFLLPAEREALAELRRVLTTTTTVGSSKPDKPTDAR